MELKCQGFWICYTPLYRAVELVPFRYQEEYVLPNDEDGDFVVRDVIKVL